MSLIEENNKKPRGRPKKNTDIDIKIVDKHTKTEYNKIYHQLHKDKINQTAKEHYYSHTEERKDYNARLQKKYRDAFKLLKEMIDNNKIYPDYTEKANDIVLVDIKRQQTTTMV